MLLRDLEVYAVEEHLRLGVCGRQDDGLAFRTFRTILVSRVFVYTLALLSATTNCDMRDFTKKYATPLTQPAAPICSIKGIWAMRKPMMRSDLASEAVQRPKQPRIIC